MLTLGQIREKVNTLVTLKHTSSQWCHMQLNKLEELNKVIVCLMRTLEYYPSRKGPLINT